MTPPPPLWGRVPHPMPRPDKRWLAVKDAKVRFRIDPPLRSKAVHDIDAWVNCHIEYRREQFDEWSPPEVTLRRGYCDCEDSALLKRALLLRYGVPETSIYFLLAQDVIAREPHALLLVDDGGWKVLDSRPALKMTLPVEEVRDYVVLEAMQDGGRWKYE